jgi:glutamyl-tRNA(Gln) amidotransferase subunit D
VVPEIADISAVDADILYSVFSENIGSEHWTNIARKIEEKVQDGSIGVIITHGTDTLAYSAAALSFALRGLPIPVIFVGSQRSSDRPSSDAATNLIGAVSTAVQAPFGEVVVGMHGDTSDKVILFHRGTKVRKCHTSARYAFRSVNANPLARLVEGRLEILESNFHKRGEGNLALMDRFEDKVSLLKFHPDFNPDIIHWLLDDGYKGIILEGTGLGHVSSRCYEALDRAFKEGVFVGMTSQCIWGRIDMNVYTTGRELLQKGVEPLDDILPETALVKLMWCLGNTDGPEDVRLLMRKNIAGEYTDRTLFEGRT